jgi:hypothetical protein
MTLAARSVHAALCTSARIISTVMFRVSRGVRSVRSAVEDSTAASALASSKSIAARLGALGSDEDTLDAFAVVVAVRVSGATSWST